MRIFTLLFIFFVSNLTLVEAQETNKRELISVQFDTKFRQEIMTNDLLSLEYAISRVKGDYCNWLNNKGEKQSTGIGKVGKAFLRLAKIGLIDYPLANNLMIINHEINGHAAASIETNQKVKEISIPFKYYGKSFHYLTKPKTQVFDAIAFVAFESKPNYTYTYSDLAVDISAGMNAGNVLRQNINKNVLSSGRMHLYQSLQTLMSHWDFWRYSIASDYGASDDVSYYLNFVNARHVVIADSLFKPENSNKLIKYQQENFKFLPDQILSAGYVNVLGDPNFYISVYNVLWKYLIKGEPVSKYKKIGNDRFSFMPSVGAYLSPFGIEYFGQLSVSWHKRNYILNVRRGSNGYGDKFSGYGIKVLNLIETDKLVIGGSLDYFDQPKIQFGKELATGEAPGTTETKGGKGLMAQVNIDYKLLNGNVPMYLTGTLGYKSTGFVPGQFIKATPIISAGIAFDIQNKH
jgi:hypothetical protein